MCCTLILGSGAWQQSVLVCACLLTSVAPFCSLNEQVLESVRLLSEQCGTPLSTLLPPPEQKWVVSSTGHLLLEEALSSDMHCPSLSFTSPLFHLSSHCPVSSSASNIWRHLLPSHLPPTVLCSVQRRSAHRSTEHYSRVIDMEEAHEQTCLYF